MTGAVLEKFQLENNSIDGWPSIVDMKVIDPGVVHYEDLKTTDGKTVGGNILVQKAALDKIMPTYLGKPIVNWDHRKVNPKEYNQGTFQGIVTEVYYDSVDGWWHARGYVWDEATRKNIEAGHSISCAYNVSEWGDGGEYHKVPYVKEAINGKGTHIAVVSVPRYEGARIELLNSAKGGVMGLLSLFKKDKPGEKVEIDIATSTVAVEGHGNKTIEELVNSFVKSNPSSLNDMDLIDVPGHGKKTVLELKSQFLHNAESDKMEKEHKDGEHKENAKKNCGMCNSAAKHEPTNLKEKAGDLPKVYNSDEEKKKAEEEERKNAEEKEKEEIERKNAEKAKEDEERKNSADRAAKLDELRNKGGVIEMPKFRSVSDLAAEGAARYGSAGKK